MIRPVIKVDGKRYVVIEEHELRQLEHRASTNRSAQGIGKSDALPSFPPTDEHGNRPAVAFARASIATSIIRDRHAAGLSQEDLARLAGVRQETISRIESGKHSPTIRTVEKIDRVLKQTAINRRKPRASRKRR